MESKHIKQLFVVFSYLGYLTQEVSSLSTSMSVTLQEDVSKLEEVVVVGYGSQTKKTLTGAVGTVDSEALTLKPAQNTSELMMGQVAGLSTRQSGVFQQKFLNFHIYHKEK